ncbi:MAG: hypothetical protein IJA94_04935 [Bacilli bacterium]|nr:hypothetical protein [Bacilli bacterium]
MEILLHVDDVYLYKTNTLILGTSKKIKNNLNEELKKLNISILNDDFSFSTDFVKTELENYDVNVASFSKLGDMIDKSIDDLSISEKYFLKIILKMPIKDGVIVIDNYLTYLNKSIREAIFKYAEENNIVIIAYSQTIEDDYFFSGQIMVFMQDKLAISGPAKVVLEEDKILKRLGYRLPFIVDLSNQLKLYGMVSKTCYSDDELVGELWK